MKTFRKKIYIICCKSKTGYMISGKTHTLRRTTGYMAWLFLLLLGLRSHLHWLLLPRWCTTLGKTRLLGVVGLQLWTPVVEPSEADTLAHAVWWSFAESCLLIWLWSRQVKGSRQRIGFPGPVGSPRVVKIFGTVVMDSCRAADCCWISPLVRPFSPFRLPIL